MQSRRKVADPSAGSGSAFEKTDRQDGKLLLAKMLAWFGDGSGNILIGNELAQLFELEQEDGYPKGYIDDYDSIRGREKNKLEGLFWKINQNIALLGMSGNGSETKTVRRILEKDRLWRRNGAADQRLLQRTHRYQNRCLPQPHSELVHVCRKAARRIPG